MGTKHEALLYEKLDGKKVHCFLCPRDCRIADGKSGYCGVRKNEGGTLYTMIYGVVSSVNVDPIEKKPLFHYLPGSKCFSLGTLGCNMRCIHCQNWQISFAGEKEVSASEGTNYLSPEKAIDMALQSGSKSIAWTYNEPTIWMEYTLDCAKIAKKAGLKTIYVTNGYITPQGLDTIGPYLDVFRVDIKGFTKEFYSKLAKIKNYETILDATIRAKKKWNMHVEAITLIIPDWNDDEAQLSGIANWIKDNLGPDTPWHVTQFMPYLELADKEPTPIPTLERAQKIGTDAGLKYVYIGNVPGHKGENTYCPNCSKLLIERVGYKTQIIGMSDNKCANCGESIPVII